MTLPASIRVNVKAPFPSQVVGGGFVTVSKLKGVYTLGSSYAGLAPLLAFADLPASLIAVYDPATKQFNTVTASQVISSSLIGYRLVIAAGDVTIGASDLIILLAKTVPAATNIILPTALSRGGLPVTVKDYGYNAAANNIRFVMAGTETLDGFTQAQADTNGASKMTVNGMKKIIYPLTSGGWYL
jgi:hypothetical protein